MSFKRFDPQDVVISAESISTPVWSGNVTTLDNFVTSSTQIGGPSGEYYYNVYQASASAESARVQFSLTYGNKSGYGSLPYNPIVPGKSPSSTIYGQYRSLVLGDEDTDFSFGNIPSDHFYAIAIDRARYKEKLLPASLNLVISGSTNLHLTDNSTLVSVDTFLDCGRVYQLISGSNGTSYDGGTGYSTNQGSYGLVLPDISTIILNPLAISSSIGVEVSRSLDAPGENISTIFNAISGAASFEVNSEETLSSDYVFVRARNSEFNYSENPSYISGSTGDVLFASLINSPQSYVTTVGLYNDTNELLAVAKLSKPLVKDFTKETLLRVKLDF